MDKLVLKREIAASAEKVWAALTDPEQMRQWYFPMMPDFKPAPGFRTEFDVHHNGKIFPHVWTVTEVKETEVIAYNWRYKGYEGDSYVRFSIDANNNLSTLTLECLVTKEYDTEEHPELSSYNFTAGWNQLLDSLGSFLTKK